MFKAFIIKDPSDLNEEGTPVDMKGTKLETDDDVRAWLFGPGHQFGNPMGPGYLKTHPELDGQHIQVRLVDN